MDIHFDDHLGHREGEREREAYHVSHDNATQCTRRSSLAQGKEFLVYFAISIANWNYKKILKRNMKLFQF